MQVVDSGRRPANYLGAWQRTDPAPFDEEQQRGEQPATHSIEVDVRTGAWT